ncbi:hypothetical protein I2W78_01065 [Streptomyces spinoverrucosus]|uniref:hypothetical protein n=1 Tax=Streptomyces spinoverrucosus TaxID=284043 RepID=UPI0018C409C4|nr:hypothetical protein [Streptomyces spinoverrucosus]MBG0850482.1 hypothetical protein [Streptomyces spinoverrucosus]
MITYADVPLDQWRTEVFARVGLPRRIEQHIVTRCRLRARAAGMGGRPGSPRGRHAVILEQ